MINRYMARLLDELRAGDMPDPLSERVLLAATWDDLCRLAGEVPPPDVRLVLEDLAPAGPTASGTGPASAGTATTGVPSGTAPRTRGGGR